MNYCGRKTIDLLPMSNSLHRSQWPLSWLLTGMLLLVPSPARASETWQTTLAQMPLGGRIMELNRTNCVAVMLHAFQSNQLVKAMIFMPGATDEFYFLQRARAALATPSPTLLDAVTALTNQTMIRATFRPPLLLLHTGEDPIEAKFRIENEGVAKALKQKQFLAHVLYNDRDWDYLQPILTQTLGTRFLPVAATSESWHFYRHSFAAWNLNGWEALEAISLAGKTTFSVRRSLVFKKPVVVFQGDTRVPGKIQNR